MPSSESPAVTPAARAEQALVRLRERVVETVAELERLRDENQRLAERVRTLAESEVLRDTPVALPAPLDGDPEALRAQVRTFIEAIDQALNQDAGAPPPSAS